MKKGLLLLSTLLLVFGIIACDQLTTTIPMTTTTEASTTTSGGSTTTQGTTTTQPTTVTTTTGVTTAVFSISLSGLTDAGFEEPKIYANQLFDLLDGVHAFGSDGVDYADRILLQSDDAACQIDDDGMLMSTGAKTCIVTYTVVVNSKMARATRNIKISAAPITIVFTETSLINNETWLGTDATAPELASWNGSLNTWYHWKASAAVFGTTGGVRVEGDKLIIVQEDLGGVGYGLQSMMLTDVPLEAGRTYKITFTLTSTSDRYIDIVTKAPNNNYGLDTHSIIEVLTGTFEYEMVFVANQAVLHMNIMSGVIESSVNVGTLEFSNFKLWEGPIVIDYEELPDFFKNDTVAVGTAIGPIPTGGTDSDFLRSFYYWKNDGELNAEVVEGGFEVEIVTPTTVDYGTQFQWNDMLKQDFTLIKGAMYKLTMKVNATTARIMEVNVTGDHYSKPTSVTQRFDLVVGDNIIEVEFESLYDYFFMKLNFGNYGDLVQTGIFTITDLKLFVDVKAEPEDPVDPDPDLVVGNVFGTVANVNDTPLGVESLDLGENYVTHEIVEIPTNTFYLWYGIAATGWFTWAEYPTVTSRYIDKGVNLDIEAAGTEFWSIQLKYKGTGVLVKEIDYLFSFVVYAENARRINVQLKDAAFASAYIDANIDLVAGYNLVEIPFTGTDVATFNMQMNLGTFTPDSGEEGALEFRNFVVSRPTQEIEGYVDNGDFATDATFAAADAVGWAIWTTEGVTDGWGLPNYIGTTTMAAGVMTNTTTQTGGAVWACQIQYNSEIADMTVGAVYRVELDINSNVATQIVIQLKNADNGLNQDTFVDLLAGDNHVTLFYVASQEQFRLFIMPGLVAPGTTLVIDNIKYFEPLIPETPVDPVDPIDYWPVVDGIQNGNFDAVGFGVNVEGSGWTSWTTLNEGWATHQLDATFTVTDGAVVVDILGTGGQVWYIQLCYRPTDVLLNVEPGKHYKIEFDVNASVGGTFSMEMSTTGNVANVAIPVTLVAGANHVVVEYIAYEANFKLTACLGLYGIATLTFDNFVMSEEVVLGFDEIENGIQNGDFSAVGFGVNVADSGWTSWTTLNEGWATHQLDATFNVTDGAIVANILGTGGQVWYIQLCYRPTDVLLNVIPGHTYRVEFDVNASVAGTFSMEMTTTGNAANVAIPVTLVVGANHVVVEYIAYEANFKLTACLGLYGIATLTFDNFKVYEAVPFEFTPIADGIQNGDFSEVGFGVNVADSGWTSWTTLNEGWATHQLDATFTVTDGAIVADVLGTGGQVWYIQLCYRPTDVLLNVIPGQTYRVEFDVNASVAGTFSMEMTTTGNAANVAIPVTLVVGANHVVVEYIAYEANFKLTACLGLYGIATLTFDNFVVSQLGPRA